MLTSPARVLRGDPDMTRRLRDRAHVRRQGQTRCYVERFSSLKQPADLEPVPSSPELNVLLSAPELQVCERLRGDPDSTVSPWTPCPTCRASPSNGLVSAVSIDRNSLEKPISILAGSSGGFDSCDCRLLRSPSRYILKDHHSRPSQQDELHNIETHHTQFETGGTTVAAAQHLKRSQFEEKISRSCYEQSRTAPKRGPGLFLSSLLLILYVLLLLPKTLVAKPASSSEREAPGHLILKTPLCEPVSHEDLVKIMGPYFDPSKMAVDESTARRSKLSNYFDHSSVPGFQGDDPRATRVPGSDNLVREEIIISEEDSEWDDDDDDSVSDKRFWIKDKEFVEDVYDGETREETVEEDDEIIEENISSKRFDTPESSSELPEKYKHKHRQHRTDALKTRENHPRHRIVTGSYAYMKRRRRRRSSQNNPNSDAFSRRNEYVNRKNNVSSHGSSTNNSNSNWVSTGSFNGARRSGRYVGANNKWQPEDAKRSEDLDDIDVDSRSDIGLLPLQIAASKRPDKKLRKSLKQKFRKNAKYLLKRKPPWQCKMTSKTLIMADGVFPRVLVDGNCGKNRKCFYRLYNCEPQRYIIKLMQRDPNHCNPLPRVGNKTVFEERWNLISRPITVGCNCVNAPLKNRKSNKKWRWGRRRKNR